jgi:hypothetical protein
MREPMSMFDRRRSGSGDNVVVTIHTKGNLGTSARHAKARAIAVMHTPGPHHRLSGGAGKRISG